MVTLTNPKISVIVPVYNVESFLDTCIFSIVNQTYENLEIILIDDGSTDSSPQICDKWALIDNRIHVIHKKNGGLSDARNCGLDNCTGELIAFVDSDDWISDSMYAIMLSTMKNSSADICSCGRVYEGNRTSKPVMAFTGSPELALEMLFSYPAFPVDVWNKLYKKEIWEGVRFPKGKLYEDVFVICHLLDKAKNITQITDKFYHYRIRSGSITNSIFSVSRMNEEEGWRHVCTYIQHNHPSLYRKALAFYLVKVAIIISSTEKTQRHTFREEYDYMYNIIRKNFLFCLFYSKMTYLHKLNLLKIVIKIDLISPCIW